MPQAGSLSDHMDIFAQHVNELIPDVNNDGLAVIDFESWRPVYRQNFGTLQPYKDLSVHMVRQAHPLWSDRRIEEEASRRFEESAHHFMGYTLQMAKKLRPLAKWGYYGLPYCFNGRDKNIEDCPDNVRRENDQYVNNKPICLEIECFGLCHPYKCTLLFFLVSSIRQDYVAVQ